MPKKWAFWRKFQWHEAELLLDSGVGHAVAWGGSVELFASADDDGTYGDLPDAPRKQD